MSSEKEKSEKSDNKPEKPDIPLFMECVDEDPEPVLQEYYDKQNEEFKAAMKKLENLCKAGAGVTPNADSSVTFRLTESTTTMGSPGAPSAGITANTQATAAGGAAGNYRLLMDPKTGRIIGSVPISSTTQPVLPSPGIVRAPTQTPVRGAAPRSRMMTPSSKQPIRPNLKGTPTPPTRTHTPPGRKTTPSKSPQIVDLTSGPEPVGAPPIRRPFPALAVVAKPQRTVPGATAKRSELDTKVKGLLVHTPAKFTEWLIQQGMVRSEQYDNSGGGKVKLKLGMYSDGKKFPHSGGYVWIQEGAANKYTSVYKGSIFETTNHAPTVILKMIYHWSCQTNLPNVAQWVKVDNGQIDSFYTHLRSICVGAVQDEINNMGGPNKIVEIGVISLGTTTADGQKREVRVEVLGVLDRSTKNLRLRATEPIQGASQSDRFGKIFETLPIWINKNSKIVTDYSVDRETLSRLGFKNVSQCTLNAAQTQRSDTTNQQIMDYLKKVVPKMFQNTLSNLTTPTIQQFLDELTFRELFGQYPLASFEQIIQKITAQTNATAQKDETMIRRLNRIATNPFDDWRYSPQPDMETEKVAIPRRTTPSPNRYGIDALPPSLRAVDNSAKRASSVEPDENIDMIVTKKMKLAKELVQLESYFYATVQGDVEILNTEFKADMAFKCHLCKKLFMNNVEFMKHLHLHVESDRATAVDLADLTQCKYCYKDFETPFKMQEHYEEIHLRKGSEFVCRICDEPFKMKNHLIHHMGQKHMRSEMPYQCKICNFRSSMHRDCIDHFHEAHDRTDKLQCPLCLKTYSLYGEKGYMSSIAVTFMQHLQKHEDIKNKKYGCKKCCLNFHNEAALKVHVEKDHVSFKDFDNLEPYQYVASDEPIQMPKPDEGKARTAAKKSGFSKAPQQQSAFAAQNLEDMVMYDVDKDRCCECDRNMTLAGHYNSYLCCTKCRYSSCCARAMSVHVQMFHSQAKPVFTLGTPVVLDEDIYCCCGWHTTSGNKMAKHLATRGCKSAYPSKEEAKKAQRVFTSAEFAPLISLDEEEQMAKGMDPAISISQAYKAADGVDKEGKKERKDQEEGPLAFLGLQRKESVDDEEGKDEEKKNTEDEQEDMEIDAEMKRKSKTKKKKGTGEKTRKESGSKDDGDDNDDKEEEQDDNDEAAEDEGEKASSDKEDNEDDAEEEKDVEEEEKPSGPPPPKGTILFGTFGMFMGGERTPSQEKKDEESPEKKDESPEKKDEESEEKKDEQKMEEGESSKENEETEKSEEKGQENVEMDIDKDTTDKSEEEKVKSMDDKDEEMDANDDKDEGQGQDDTKKDDTEESDKVDTEITSNDDGKVNDKVEAKESEDGNNMEEDTKANEEEMETE